MTPPSFLVHLVVEYLIRSDFDLESDEILDIGVEKILAGYDIFLELSKPEYYLLLDELLVLGEQNEINEAMVKTIETMPEDSGVVYFRDEANEEKATVYSIPYSYPVDRNLRGIGRGGNKAPLLLI